MKHEGEPLTASEIESRDLRPPGGPSVHIRVLITWLVIFPLVAVGMTATSPFVEDWHPVLRAFTLTLIVVPTAVYIGIPRLLGVYSQITRTRYERRVRRDAHLTRRRT